MNRGKLVFAQLDQLLAQTMTGEIQRVSDNQLILFT
jgi:hypothetical protein